MFRGVFKLAAVALLAAAPAVAGTMVFDFRFGDGGFSAAEPIASVRWEFSGSDWRVGAGFSLNRTLLSPTLVSTGGPVTVTFVHFGNFESGWDGGILATQIGSGSPAQVVTFSQDGYNNPSVVATFPSAPGNSPGFSGNFSFTSVANLGVIPAGTQFVLRFEGAWDSSVIAAAPNWRIASVTVGGVEGPDIGVPEPGSAVLLLLGGLAVLGIRVRARR